MKSFSVLTSLIFSLCQESFAQVNDDFSDGNFSDNPAWVGDTSDFIVNAAYQLQLNAVTAGTSALTTPITGGGDSTVWEFYLSQSFSPSGSNYGRVYLSADSCDLTAPLNGYYLQFGEAGSADAIELFRQTGTNLTSVCRGTASAISSAFGVRVKVIRTGVGDWEMYADYNGKTEYVLEASGSDKAHAPTGYFGLRCTYTITNASRFFLDDVRVDHFKMPDNSPPGISAVEVLSSTSLKVRFSEPISESSADPGNFFVDPDYASTVTLHDDERTVVLQFSNAFVNGYQSLLRIRNVVDLAGNAISTEEFPFLYFVENPVVYRDVIVNEIFADPSPPLGLPEAEFIELYNRSANPVDLSGWSISDETTFIELEGSILLPGAYLILTSVTAASAYSAFGQVMGLSPFPALNNGGDAIRLKDDQRSTIDSLNYAIRWYRDEEKSDGGWTLELIDADNICDDDNNWRASEAAHGGTPGIQNSVAASRPDNTGPALISAVALDALTIQLSFDENLAAELPDLNDFKIDPPREITRIRFDGSLSRIRLHLSEEIEKGISYTLSVSDVYDCPGNRIRESARIASFILPQTAESGDVIVNEILFNPRPGGVDFVELFNQSTKTVDIKGWSLRNPLSTDRGTIISSNHMILHPRAYLAVTEDHDRLKGEYPASVERNFVESKLPPLNDDEGMVVLSDGNGVVLDSVFYEDTMHTPFLQDDEGVSLERISPHTNGTGSSNWRSANSAVGFATPGYANSNSLPISPGHDESVMVDPEIIQLQAATHDFATIKYRFRQGGFMANVRIFDQQGRSIREIASNESLGTEGFFRWDGDRDNGVPASRGYYLVWFEVFDNAGLIKSFRKRIVVF